MNRRNFVQAIAASSVFGTLRAFGQTPTKSTKPVLVKNGLDRTGHRHFMGGGRIAFDAKISATDSGGGLFLWENMMTTKGGPNRHVHFDQDEWFFVLQGEYVVEVGEERFFLQPGDSIFLPRGVPHGWAHIAEGTGKLLGAVQPAGTFEQFVAEVGQTGRDQMSELMAKHGMKGMGPAIDVDNLTRKE